MAVYNGVPWRFIFTDLSTVTTTWANNLLTGRKIVYAVDQPTVITASVKPDNNRVNTLFTDGFTKIAQTNRLIYAFRREAPAEGFPWVCRAAGILMVPEDQADADVPLTSLTAYDAWQLMNARPVVDGSGNLPGPTGLYIPNATGDQIATTILVNTITAETGYGYAGNGTFIDAGVSWGGTAFWGGVIETTPNINLTMQAGSTVGGIWSQLCDAGNTDIVLRPIYDPLNRPGYTHELSIYNLAGQDREDAIFGWDRLRRNLKRVDRMHDATPGSYFNKGQYFAGQGGYPIPPTGPYVPAPGDVTIFGPYWSQQFQPQQTDTDPSGAATLALLHQSIKLAKQGKRTVTLDVIPERAPVPLQDYETADRIFVYASRSLRAPMSGRQRVQTIPIDISDDGIEQVVGLVCSPDWRNETPPPPSVPEITYTYDGVSTVTVSIPTEILVGLASDDDVFLVADDGTTQDSGPSWPDSIVTSDPMDAYGPTLTMTLPGIAYESDATFGSTADYFVTPRNATVFRVCLLVMAGTDAAGGQAPPDLGTFARIGTIKTFTYGVASSATSAFPTLPIPLPLPTGGGGSGPTGDPWSWDASTATVDPSSASLVAAWLGYAIGAGTYFTAAVAVADASGGTPFYSIPTSEAVSPVSAPVPTGTRAGASADLSLTVRQTTTDYDFGLAIYDGGTNQISHCFGGTIAPITAVYEPAPNSANAACFPLRQGPITVDDVSRGHIDHPLVFTMPNCGPAPNPYPARPGSAGYPGNTGFPLGTWMRLDPAVDVAGLGLPAFETMICICLQTWGMFLRDIGSTFDIIGIDPVNQGGSTPAPWAGVGVNLNIGNGHGVNYAVALDAGMPWSSMQVLVAP